MSLPPNQRNPKGIGGFGDHPENINKDGRPRPPEIEIFREALNLVEKEQGKTLLEFAIRKAFTDPQYKCVLLELIRKMLPSMQNVNLESFTLDQLAQVIRKGTK